MPTQPNLYSETPQPADQDVAQSAAVAAPPSAYAQHPNAAPIWLQRASLLVLVLFCLYLGAFVAVLPWWRAVWDRNLFFQAHPRLWSVLRLGGVRGLISGLGLLDVWIGISEALNYREISYPPPPAPEARPHG